MVPKSLVVSRPSCPDAFSPQHFVVASSSSAHVWLPPAEIEIALAVPKVIALSEEIGSPGPSP